MQARSQTNKMRRGTGSEQGGTGSEQGGTAIAEIMDPSPI